MAVDKERMEEVEAPADKAPSAPLSIAPAPVGFKALVVCAEGSEEASIAAGWAVTSRGAGATVSVCPPGFLASHSKTAAGTYDSVVVEGGEAVGADVLEEVLKLLKARGQVNVVFESGAASTSSKRRLTFAGFVGVTPSTQDERVLLGQRASWEPGASAPVRLPIRKPGANVETGNSTIPPAEKKTWKLAIDGDDDGGVFGAGADSDDDLVDEDALLESSAPVKRTNQNADSCATKRRACKDCTCGRSENDQEGENGVPQPIVSVSDVDDVLTSACGNCSRGDAFRCGGCPFLGKPAFEKGQERLVMLSDLDAQQDN
ncbi:unnamed protein product [Ascophyllum nodosum]